MRQDAGGSVLVQNYGMPFTVADWRAADDSFDPAEPTVTVSRLVSGSPATAVSGAAKLYVVELDILGTRKTAPLTSVTLPSTGASLTTVSGCDRPRLHVFAITTRNDS
ncbi:hypothetical protein ACFQ3F_04840 [Nocardioides ginsengisoli]|uniref:Uncharacterized protein n=1 Tax=Nocardioides ginsengisoli TaxID=363868 RepID=A0ABW3VWI7_9ACTN